MEFPLEQLKMLLAFVKGEKEFGLDVLIAATDVLKYAYTFVKGGLKPMMAQNEVELLEKAIESEHAIGDDEEAKGSLWLSVALMVVNIIIQKLVNK